MLKRSIFFLFMLSVLVLSGCFLEIDDNAVVTNITVEPSTISQADLNKNLKVVVTVTIQTSGVDKQNSKVFVSTPARGRVDAKPKSVEAEQDSIVFQGISGQWLQGLTPGSYNVGVTLLTTTGQITVDDPTMGQLTITK